MKKLAQEEIEYNQKLDSKIAVWLQNLEISENDKSVEYKSLKRHLTDLYLLRHDWARDLINRRDRTTDDFKIEAEKRLNLSIFFQMLNQRFRMRKVLPEMKGIF